MRYSFFDIDPGSAHPEILAYLAANNLDHFIDPEEDKVAALGPARIKKVFGLPDADIHFMPNGTSSNVVGLSAMLKPFEGVICPATGHINNYEAGALEATGHKVIAVESINGKLTTRGIDDALQSHEDYLTVKPKVVYLTNVTEEGTVYSRSELEEIVAHAKKHGLYTFLDGARLAMALASKTAAITMPEFGQLGLDMFYIGGTKNGGLYGEALVINNDELKPDFEAYMKRQGADMGKQRPMSLQFARFFDEDNLWLKLAEHANLMAGKLRQGLKNSGAELVNGDANHAFVTISDSGIKKLQADYDIPIWQKIDPQTSKVRLVCSWATKNEDIDGFIGAFKSLN